jgi:hypothetical protein
MMQAARDFTINLRSGLRLALGRPVSLLDFRASVLQLVLLYGFGVALDIGVDYVQTGWGATFSPHGFVTEGFGAAVLLLTAAILANAFRQPHLRLALPVLVVASTPSACPARSAAGATSVATCSTSRCSHSSSGARWRVRSRRGARASRCVRWPGPRC